MPPEEERAGRSASEWLCAKIELSRYMINTRNLTVFNMHFQAAPFSPPPPWEKPTGLKWQEAGDEPPEHGSEIMNAALLAAAIQSNLQISDSEEEWDNFEILNLSYNYIKMGNKYFKPAKNNATVR